MCSSRVERECACVSSEGRVSMREIEIESKNVTIITTTHTHTQAYTQNTHGPPWIMTNGVNDDVGL